MNKANRAEYAESVPRGYFFVFGASRRFLCGRSVLPEKLRRQHAQAEYGQRDGED